MGPATFRDAKGRLQSGRNGAVPPCPQCTRPIPLQIGATMSIRPILATVLAVLAFSAEASAKTHHAGAKSYNVSDAALVQTLPGFNSSFATVNGIRLHYVAGGQGDPVFLLPGWPETWWSYHKIMPELAKRHRVISIDLRGMGSSDKPAAGYDKKSMAGCDLHPLPRRRRQQGGRVPPGNR